MHFPLAVRKQNIKAAFLCGCGLLACALSLATHLSSQAARSATPDSIQLARQLHEALSLAQHGQPRQAFDHVNTLLEKHPQYAPALKLRGMLLESAGRNQEAEASYELALKLAPNDADMLFKVGVYQLINGNHDSATPLLAHYVKLQPNDPDGLYYLAQAYHLAGQNDSALKAIKSANALKPNDPPIMQKFGELLSGAGDNENAIPWLEKAAAADPTLNRIEYDLGVASLYSMDLDNAEKHAEAAAKNPHDTKALELLAAVKVKLADWSTAKSLYAQLLAQTPDDVAAALGLGHAQVELGEYAGATDTLNALLQRDPTVALAHYYLARAYAATGHPQQAQYEADVHHKLMEATSFNDTSIGTESDKAAWNQAKTLLAQKNEAAALLLFQQSAAANESRGHPLFMLGVLYLYLGDGDNGVRTLQRALALDPKTRGAHTYLGVHLLQHDKLDEAEREFNAELALDANYLQALAELGVIRYRQQRWEDSIDFLLRSHTKTPALLLQLTDAYFKVGDLKNARLTAELIVAYAKDDQAALDDLSALLRANHEDALAQKISGIRK